MHTRSARVSPALSGPHDSSSNCRGRTIRPLCRTKECRRERGSRTHPLEPVREPLAAQITTAVELGVPPLLFAGLATRIATLPLLGMIAVIQIFVYPNAWSDHLLWASALALVLTRGPGVFSVDHWIASRSRPRVLVNDSAENEQER
jgi:hypothetical protein